MDPVLPDHRSDTATSPAPADELAVQNIVAQLKRVILDELQVPVDEAKIDPHMSLLDGGLGLDSITLFELITLIEKRYGISFPVENLNTEVFASLTVVAKFIHSMMSHKSAPGASA